MNAPRWRDVPWFPIVNDLIGGWAVANANKPSSELNFEQGDYEIACFAEKKTAEHIAALHNTWLKIE